MLVNCHPFVGLRYRITTWLDGRMVASSTATITSYAYRSAALLGRDTVEVSWEGDEGVPDCLCLALADISDSHIDFDPPS